MDHSDGLGSTPESPEPSSRGAVSSESSWVGPVDVRNRARAPGVSQQRHRAKAHRHPPTPSSAARVSKQEQVPDDDTDLRQSKWVLGHNLRSRGSVHSDWWEGPAVELAASSVLAVYPVGGWWKDRRDAERFDRRVRYSLVVSIETPRVGVDIYTPVQNAIATVVPV